jgi:hypothetical protein
VSQQLPDGEILEEVADPRLALAHADILDRRLSSCDSQEPA